MNLEAKISGTHHFIFGEKDADLNAEEKLNQIMRYIVEKTVKTSSIERALQEQSQNVANLMAENADLKAKNQTLQQEIENERAKSTQYSRNLWSILDALGEQEAIVHFTKRL